MRDAERRALDALGAHGIASDAAYEVRDSEAHVAFEEDQETEVLREQVERLEPRMDFDHDLLKRATITRNEARKPGIRNALGKS